MSKLPAAFPILTLGPRHGPLPGPDKDRLDWYGYELGFDFADVWDRRRRRYQDTLIVDANAKTWRIMAVKDRGPLQTLLRLLRMSHRVRYTLAPGEPLSFEEVKARVCRHVEENPQDWRDYLLYIGEPDDEPTEQEYDEYFRTKVKLIHAANNVVDLIKALNYLYPGDED